MSPKPRRESTYQDPPPKDPFNNPDIYPPGEAPWDQPPDGPTDQGDPVPPWLQKILDEPTDQQPPWLRQMLGGDGPPTPLSNTSPADDGDDPPTLSPDEIEGIGDKIAEGHAFDKHVNETGEFPDVTDTEDLKNVVTGTIEHATNETELSGGRSAYYDADTNTIVIVNPNSPDGGTAFRPADGIDYFDGLT